MAENNKIPEHSVKLLFAEDLMNHVMNYTVETTYKAISAERYRDFIYSAFNETIKEAVTCMYKEVHLEVMNIYLVLLHVNSVSIETYTAYAKIISGTYLKDNCNALGFLHYCARLAGLAMYFYKHGTVAAPNLAIKCIVCALPSNDVITNLWATLNRVSRLIVNTNSNTLSKLLQQPISGKGASDSNAGCSCFLNEYKVQIQKVAKAFNQIPKCSCYLASKDDSNKLKKCCPASFVNSSNYAENKVVNERLSDDIFAPGTTNTNGMPVRSMQGDPLHLSLKGINHERDQSVPSPTGEKKSTMLEVSYKFIKRNSDSEKNCFRNKISKLF